MTTKPTKIPALYCPDLAKRVETTDPIITISQRYDAAPSRQPIRSVVSLDWGCLVTRVNQSGHGTDDIVGGSHLLQDIVQPHVGPVKVDLHPTGGWGDILGDMKIFQYTKAFQVLWLNTSWNHGKIWKNQNQHFDKLICILKTLLTQYALIYPYHN